MHGSDAVVFMAMAASRFLSLFSVGLGFVAVAWLGASSGSLQLVGQLFFVSSLTTLGVSAFAGASADRGSRLSNLRLAWGLRAAALGALLSGVLSPQWLVASLFAFSILGAFSNSLGASAMDAAFQGAIPAARRVQLAVRLELLRQSGLVCGTALSGYLLQASGATMVVWLLAIVLAIQILLFEAVLRSYLDVRAQSGAGLLRFWLEGLGCAWRDRQLMLAMLTATLLFSVAQMTNLLVPIFVQDKLQEGSELYGLLEAAWSAGGAALLVLASVRKKVAAQGTLENLTLAAIGLLMVVFALSRSIALVVALYAVLGGLFSLGRALSEGRLLALASPEEVGRIRSASVMMTSGAGLVIFVLPSIMRSEDVVVYYCCWGVIVALAGACGYLAARQGAMKGD
jgi:MFS family permease